MKNVIRIVVILIVLGCLIKLVFALFMWGATYRPSYE